MARPLLAVALLALTACGPTVGDPCTTPNECGGQVCINQEWTPGGYCSRQCSLADPNGCPGGTICVRDALAKEIAACLRICRSPADCRAGYVCRSVKDSPQAVCVGPQGL